jgi:hypothetical protein
MQLSDTQAALLATAVGRTDRVAFPVTLPITGGAVGNVLRSLLRRGLLEEVAAAGDQTVWRCDKAGQPVTLRASAAGILLLGGTVEQEAQVEERSVEQPVSELPRRRGVAQDAVLGLLRRAEGATIADLQAATAGSRTASVAHCPAPLPRSSGIPSSARRKIAAASTALRASRRMGQAVRQRPRRSLPPPLPAPPARR